ncbi:MAG: HAD hydrolase family protein [Deltaproteobacteria bacterium]|jgi:hydroxymethylpyrimidine pyrophosphatase-like HAD family hydrolase|nr:HAD hydrolase family protein [Deltaproteobacteria bacterium]
MKKQATVQPPLWFTDFDGTLKPLAGEVSPEDLVSLKAVGEAGGVRVVATGRSVKTFLRDWSRDFELDYLISSSGLALTRWGKEGEGETLEIRSYRPEDAALAVQCSLELDIGFAFCFPPPLAHSFYYKLPEKTPVPRSFEAMINQSDRAPIPWRGESSFPLGQVLLIAQPELMREKAAVFQKRVPNLSFVFTTSPYEDGSLWLEVYPPEVSKGRAAERLAVSLGFGAEDAVALGNDYNDLDLLRWAGMAYISEKGPADLLPLFRNMPPAGKAPLKFVLDELRPSLYGDYLKRHPAEALGS